MLLLAIIFPGLSFFLRGKFMSAILAFVLQLTIIGWLPVAIWAAFSLSNSRKMQILEEMEKNILESQQNLLNNM